MRVTLCYHVMYIPIHVKCVHTVSTKVIKFIYVVPNIFSDKDKTLSFYCCTIHGFHLKMRKEGVLVIEDKLLNNAKSAVDSK